MRAQKNCMRYKKIIAGNDSLIVYSRSHVCVEQASSWFSLCGTKPWGSSSMWHAQPDN